VFCLWFPPLPSRGAQNDPLKLLLDHIQKEKTK
jgi:hypothetical protein